MIHILTQNPQVQEQLSELLGDLGQEFTFHNTLEPLLKAVRRLTKSDYVFYDLQLEDTLWAFERLYTGCKKSNLVALERLTKETSLDHNQCPAGVENYLLLPPKMERALPRVQQLLREVAQQNAKKQATRKKNASNRAKATKQPLKQTKKAAPMAATTPTFPAIARYLQALSPAMRNLLAEVQTIVEEDGIIVIEGNEGAEFELLAREINFRANGDACPLHVIDPMHLDAEELNSLLDATDDTTTTYVFLGQTVDWTVKAAYEIERFIERCDAHKNLPLRIIMAHAADSESYMADNTRPLVKTLRKRGLTICIPDMSEREEDIPMIAAMTFSTLRMAHPFLSSRILSAAAVKFLQSEAETMDYARLTRIIRNAMALSQKDVISEDTIRNLSDNSPMTQHLIESLADERYFKTAE